MLERQESNNSSSFSIENFDQVFSDNPAKNGGC